MNTAKVAYVINGALGQNFHLTISSIIESLYLNWEVYFGYTHSIPSTIEKYISDERFKFIKMNRSNKEEQYNEIASYITDAKYLKFIEPGSIMYPLGLSQMVYEMEQHNSAEFGLCVSASLFEQIFPVEWSFQDFVNYHIKKSPILSRILNDTIITTSIFNKINGFRPYSKIPDLDFMLRLSLETDTLAMTFGKVWNGESAQRNIQDKKRTGITYFQCQAYLRSFLNQHLEKNQWLMESNFQIEVQLKRRFISSFLKGKFMNSLWFLRYSKYQYNTL